MHAKTTIALQIIKEEDNMAAKPGIPMEKYYKVLEDFYAQAEELKSVRATLQAEYDFAEEKVQKLKVAEAFINATDERKAAFKAFEKAFKKGAK